MKAILKEKTERQAKSVTQRAEKTGNEYRDELIKKMLEKKRNHRNLIDIRDVYVEEKKLQRATEKWVNQYKEIYKELRKGLKDFGKLNKKEKVNLMKTLSIMKLKIENYNFFLSEFNKSDFKQAAESLSKKFQASSPFN